MKLILQKRNMSNLFRTLISFVLITPTFVSTAWACSVCFTSVKTDPLVIALKWSMVTLLGIVSVVLFYFAKFLFTLILKEERTILKGVSK